MNHQDFFAFSKTVTLIELKTLGRLTTVRHFSEGELVYPAHAPGGELFIVSRGAVELAPDQAKGKFPATVLKRGDIFGVLGALLDQPRDHAARACSNLSVQCFHRSDFAELLQKVPSFFLYLSANLARRLFMEQQLVRSTNSALELTGTLAHFDVPTIYQTICHSKQTGLLTFADGKGAVIGEFYFVEGAPKRGRFEHLVGEEAFWQLFLRDELAVTFSFANDRRVGDNDAPEEAITQNPDALLICAIHMRDEFDELRRRLLDRTVTLRRTDADFHWEDGELEELRPLAETVSQFAAENEITIGGLHRACDYSDLKIYQVVDELVRSGIIEIGLPARERMLVAQ